jgi:hypothetical protein
MLLNYIHVNTGKSAKNNLNCKIVTGIAAVCLSCDDQVVDLILLKVQSCLRHNSPAKII